MINTASQNLIKSFEGLKLTAYLCSAGKPTIGWGHTGTVKASDVGKRTIPQVEAQRLFDADVAVFEKAVDRLVKVKLTENQRGALVSFAFNLGVGNLSISTLLKRINAKADTALIEQSWLQWDKYTNPKTGLKEPLAGLQRRRKEEVALWKRP